CVLTPTWGGRTASAPLAGLGAMPPAALALLYRDAAPAGHGSGEDNARAPQRTAGASEWTLRAALHSRQLWAAFLMTALGVIGFQIMATHQVAHAVDRDFDLNTQVRLVTLAAGSMMAGRLLC